MVCAPSHQGDLVVRDVCVNLSGTQILKDVCLRAQAGRVCAVIGPNGSGKSTLLKAVTGELPHRGGISLAGIEVSRLNRKSLALRRAVLAQHTSVAFPLAVHEVVQLGRTVRGDEAGSYTVQQALDAVDLSGFGGRSYLSLSGGEQQRVHLARVLCQIGQPCGPEGPRWLFLDEPVASLDIRHQLWVMAFARSFAAQGGGVVAVMHDLNLTAQFADDVVALKAGQVLAGGTMRAVLKSELVSELYDCRLPVGAMPEDRGMPFVLPQAARIEDSFPG